MCCAESSARSVQHPIVVALEFLQRDHAQTEPVVTHPVEAIIGNHHRIRASLKQILRHHPDNVLVASDVPERVELEPVPADPEVNDVLLPAYVRDRQLFPPPSSSGSPGALSPRLSPILTSS